MKKLRFDIMFQTLTKLSIIGSLVSALSLRGMDAETHYYNTAFIELYTFIVITLMNKGTLDKAWAWGFVVLQCVSILIQGVASWELASRTCWSLDACTSNGATSLIDLGLFITSLAVVAFSALSIFSAVTLTVL